MDTEITTRISRCRSKLDQLKNDYDSSHKKMNYARTVDRNGLKVTVPYHPYQLNPCLTEKAVSAFEQKAGISLPAEYRECLLRLGNGGGLFWDELVPEKLLENEWSDIDQVTLDNEWPYETVLMIDGEQANQVWQIYLEGSGGNDDNDMLNPSFLDWLESKLDEELESPSAFFEDDEGEDDYDYNDDDDDEEEEEDEDDYDEEEEEEESDSKDDDANLKSLFKKYHAIHLYDQDRRAAIVAKMRTILASQVLSTGEYSSLLDKAFTSHLSELQALIGEYALQYHRNQTITFKTQQLGNIMELTGLGYMNLADERAISILEESIAITGNTFHYSNIANTLLKLNRLAEARKVIEKAPPTFYTLHIKGMIYVASGKNKEAKEYFLAGIEHYNQYPENHQSLADVYMSEKKYEHAETHYKHAINRCTYTPATVFYKLAKLYTITGKLKEAVEILTNLHEMDEPELLADVDSDAAFKKLVQSDIYKKFQGSIAQ